MVRVFKGLENKKKTFYAVTGTRDFYEAMREVARYTKASYTKFSKDAKVAYGTIASYEKGIDGLWFISEDVPGEPCIIVGK